MRQEAYLGRIQSSQRNGNPGDGSVEHEMAEDVRYLFPRHGADRLISELNAGEEGPDIQLLRRTIDSWIRDGRPPLNTDQPGELVGWAAKEPIWHRGPLPSVNRNRGWKYERF